MFGYLDFFDEYLHQFRKSAVLSFPILVENAVFLLARIVERRPSERT